MSAVHLGVERNGTGRPNVTKKVKLRLRIMFSLIGVGANGGSGLNLMVLVHFRWIYSLPRVLYGLEVQRCLRADMDAMERLHKSILRRL